MEEGWIERIFLFSLRFGANLSARQCKIFLFVEIVPSLFGFFLLLLLSEISILVLDLLYHGVWQLGRGFVSKRIHNELKVGYEGGRQRRILFGCYLVTGPVFAGNYLLVDSLLNFARRVVQVFQVFHDKQMKELEERETNVCYSILSSLALFNLMQSNK